MDNLLKSEKKLFILYYVLLINDMLFNNCDRNIYEIILEIAYKSSFITCLFKINYLF